MVINKIDKPAADPAACEEAVLELFLELGANDEQSNFPVVYAIGRQGIAKLKLTDDSKDLTPLLETIVKHVPSSAKETEGKALMAQPFNLGYDNSLGRLAIVRVYDGVLKTRRHGVRQKADRRDALRQITKLSLRSKACKRWRPTALPREISRWSRACPTYHIGETITSDENAAPLPAIAIDEPTITLDFFVISSPFAGREGKFVTSRQIRERLERELEVNVGPQGRVRPGRHVSRFRPRRAPHRNLA